MHAGAHHAGLRGDRVFAADDVAHLVEAVGQVLELGLTVGDQVLQVTTLRVVGVGGGHAVGEFDVFSLAECVVFDALDEVGLYTVFVAVDARDIPTGVVAVDQLIAVGVDQALHAAEAVVFVQQGEDFHFVAAGAALAAVLCDGQLFDLFDRLAEFAVEAFLATGLVGDGDDATGAVEGRARRAIGEVS